MQDIRVIPAQTFHKKPADESKMGFGKLFTDHMFVMDYCEGKGWYDPRIVPYEPLILDPSTMVLHYAQSIFEGLKAYRTPKGDVQLFRPKDNLSRMNVSAERLSIPQFDEDTVMAGLLKLIDMEREWVPMGEGTSLYVRPTIIATDPYLGVSASKTYLFFIILSPSGAYYPGGLAPVRIFVEDEYVRAVRGGLGFTKASANYAASIKAGEIAKAKGFAQVLWLDGVEMKYVEEVGAMNIFFVIDGKLVTPVLNGSILGGITRDSVIKLARRMGLEVEERVVAIEEVRIAHQEGRLNEVFGTGTAAVISPVGSLTYNDEEMVVGGGQIGPISQKLYDQLVGIQKGSEEDPMGWIVPV